MTHKICTIINYNDQDESSIERLTKAVVNHLDLKDSDYLTLKDLLDGITSISDKRFLAIVLLRLYKSHEEIFESDRSLKLKTVQLFDEVFIDKYKRLKIDPKMQTYEKLPLLIDYLETIEKSAEKLSIESLDKLDQFKQKFLGTINGMYKDVITPFLEIQILEDIPKIFELIEVYKKNANIDTYNELKEELDLKIEILERLNTQYNNVFLLCHFKKILDLVKNDFNKNPDSKPSKVIITSTGKKYPLLSSPGTTFNLLIQLKNVDQGKAYDTNIQIKQISDDIQFYETNQFVGIINGQKNVNIQFDALVKNPCESMSVEVTIQWNDFSRKSFTETKKLIFNAQKIDIDWITLKENDAYSIEAVDNEDALIGRDDILNELYAGLNKKKNIHSYYLYGQKRVGKTSIAKALLSKIEKDKDNFIVLYMEAGESVGTSFKDTIQNLGNKICKQIKRMYKTELDNIDIPKFNDSIQPLADFLDDVSYQLKDKKIIFILDEFDEISSELYKRGDIGNAFFLTIRSLSNKSNYSFILVGGEKIEFIINIQGEQLNKFNSCRVDYFDKEHWTQYKEFVEKPVYGYLDITEQAIDQIYTVTAGNPFFTNVICKEMLNLAIENRDSHITDIEIDIAIQKSIDKAESQIFSHFWEDGIREDNDKEEEESYKRRIVLLTLASLENDGKQLSKQYILDRVILEFNENEIKRILKEFVDRKILIEDHEIYSFRIDFFKQWLTHYGSEKIIMTLSDEQKIRRRATEEKASTVTSLEIINLINEKQFEYKGKLYTADDIRNYLEQFGDNIKQRLIFEILQNITYFGVSNVISKMKVIFKLIRENLIERKSGKVVQYSSGQRVTNVLISNLDQIGKSSATYAKYFGDNNIILAKNIVEKERILERLNKNDIDILVFIDDFLGTGNSILEYISGLKESYPEIFTKNIDIFIGIITGFQKAKEEVEDKLIKMGVNNIKIIICEPLNERDICFSESSKIFTNPDKRRDARDLCENIGITLVNKHPLGYGNCQSTIIFPETCPNNCLPILWAKNENFTPLFERVIN